MRFSTFSMMMELCASISDALTYMKLNSSAQLSDDCILAMNTIILNLEGNRSSVTDISLFDKAEQLKTKLATPSNNVDYNATADALADFVESAKKGIKKIYKLLFVAELGGKWDSMSSVYYAAKKRDDCEVDIVVEPIFRAVTLPDGSVRTNLVNESFLPELGIEPIPYNKYSIEVQAPDITFISQPYESVTVPAFWPENIAKHSKLVYLPYFTIHTINNKLSSLSFMNMPVQWHSWKIACQSEVMADYYRGMGTRKGENVVVTGLPKWDDPVNNADATYDFPEEWKKKLEGKKVFLWNTHFNINGVAELLQSRKKFLDFFKKRKDIALIWRPHPMTETIFKTYYPDRYKDYLHLIHTVDNSDNMVMDRNSSYLPAFSASDAMITDYSSLIDAYLFEDKPLLMMVEDSIEAGRKKWTTIDGLYDFSKIPFAATFDEQKEFINCVATGKNRYKENLEQLRKTYYVLADGKCGERLLNTVLEDYAKEIEPTEQELFFENNKTVLIGKLNESTACIKQLEANGMSFCFVEELLDSEGSGGYDTISLKELPQYNNELVVITSRTDPSTLREFICDNYRIKRQHTILFWQLYNANIPIMVCDRVMMNPKKKSYDGLILGINHTEVGIVKEQLKGDWCNLAVSLQDLYFQHKTLEYCIQKYPQKLKNLKYAIIDLYDYTYFGYNTSYSRSAIKYLSYGGFNLDPHDFDKCHLNKATFIQTMSQLTESRFKYLTNMDLDIWDQIFPDIYEYADYEGFCSNYDNLRTRIRVVTDDDVKAYPYERGIVKKAFEETVESSKLALEGIFKLLKDINPNIKIYTVVIPKYIATEALDAGGLAPYVESFNAIVAEMQKKHDFVHLDFKKISNISHMKNMYFDAAHLNFYGATFLTAKLNDIIFSK